MTDPSPSTSRPHPVVTCQECAVELAADSPDMRLESHLRQRAARLLLGVLGGASSGPVPGRSSGERNLRDSAPPPSSPATCLFLVAQLWNSRKRKARPSCWWWPWHGRAFRRRKESPSLLLRPTDGGRPRSCRLRLSPHAHL